MTPSISVVIPLYNKAPHIQKTLRSVLSQTVLPAEIIVVDDGSTDNGSEIVKSIKHPLIKLIKQPNKGVSAARNKGVELSKGQYIAFLDADDYWYENHLSVLTELINLYPGAGVLSSLHEIKHAEQIIKPKSVYPVGFMGEVDDFFQRFSAGLSLINSSTACVKKDVLIMVGGFPVGVKRGEDLMVWIKIANHFKMAHAAITTVVYNRDAVNRSVKIRTNEAPGSLQLLAEMLQNDKNRFSSIQKLFACIAFYTCAGMREEGDDSGVKSILALVKQLRMYRLFLKISVLLITPPSMLTYARKWRH